MSESRRTIGTLIFILTGPLLWAGHLTAIYGSQSSMCAFGVGTSDGGQNLLVSGIIGVVTLAFVALIGVAMARPHTVLGWLARREPPPDRTFLTWVMRLLAALSALAIIYAGAAAIILPACAQLR